MFDSRGFLDIGFRGDVSPLEETVPSDSSSDVIRRLVALCEAAFCPRGVRLCRIYEREKEDLCELFRGWSWDLQANLERGGHDGNLNGTYSDTRPCISLFLGRPNLHIVKECVFRSATALYYINLDLHHSCVL